MGDFTEYLRILASQQSKRRKRQKKLGNATKKKRRKRKAYYTGVNQYTLQPLEDAGLMTKKFDPDEPRDEKGRWSLADAVAHILAQEAEENGPDMSYPDVDLHAPWQAISYNGKNVSPSNLERVGGNTSKLSSSVVPREEEEAMDEYVAFDKDTLKINQKLRNGHPPLTSEELKRNNALDEVAKKSQLNEDTDHWRGAVLSREQANSLETGVVFRDSGYASSSPSKDVAEYYLSERTSKTEGQRVMFRIRGKKGDSIIPVRNDEWVIPRGTELVVVNRRRGSNGIEVEVEYR